MTKLSWLIYLASVCDSTLLVLCVSSIFCGFAYLFIKISNEILDERKPISRIYWIIPVVFAVLLVFLPSSKTIYMMAASQAVEVVVKDPQSQDIFNDLVTVIQQKLKKEIKDANNNTD